MARLRVGTPDRICLHHSAVSPGAKDLSSLKKRIDSYEISHSKKDWAETIKTKGEYGYYYVEYHRAIAKNGHEMVLQDDKYVLYHAGDNFRGKDSFNLHGIAVLIDGNYDTENYTPQQLEAFARIIARFEKQYKVNVIVRGHKQTSKSPTACPGKNLGTHESGFLKKAIDRANVILKNNLPTNPLQDDVVADPCEKYKTEITQLKSEIVKYQKGIEALEESNDNLRTELGELQSEIQQLDKEWESKNAILKTENARLIREKGELQHELSIYKSDRFAWLIEWLNKVIPKKDE